jgi:hypothetical protein
VDVVAGLREGEVMALGEITIMRNQHLPRGTIMVADDLYEWFVDPEKYKAKQAVEREKFLSGLGLLLDVMKKG